MNHYAVAKMKGSYSATWRVNDKGYRSPPIISTLGRVENDRRGRFRLVSRIVVQRGCCLGLLFKDDFVSVFASEGKCD